MIIGNMISREEIIIRTMPFHDQLVEWCTKSPEFLEALKIVYPERFIALGAIYTSSSPYVPKDEVIGFVVYDMKEDIFKQDFIINTNKAYKKFVLYTKLPENMPKTYHEFVRPIGEFYSKYGKGTHYLDTHHIRFEDIEDSLKPRAIQAMKLAEKLKQNGFRQPTQEELGKIEVQLQRERKRRIIGLDKKAN